MVVLEGGGMLTSGSNQYLQPDYLSPLPTTLDAKKSPLALLAQTCSQIGADSPSSKPLIPPLEKAKKPSSGSAGGAVSAAADSPAQSPAAAKRSSPASGGSAGLAFKPYEANVLTKKTDVSDARPPSSKAASESADEHRKSVSSRAPSRKSASPPSASAGADKVPATTPSTSGAATSTTPSADRGKSASPSASPIIRSGLEILHGHPKDLPLGTYKAGALSSGLAGLCSGCPPGLEPTNPAFRPPFAGGPFSSHQHAAATAAMLAASGYPSPAPGPYVSYARVKTASGGEALVPVCKDPYCTGCQYSSAAAAAAAAHQQLLLCPSGCTQCDHHKYGLAALSAGLVPPLPYARPYVCNWIVGETYCGKRFTTSDELLQHLRTHTSLAGAAGDSAAAAAAAAASMSLLGGAGSPFLPHRYPNPPLSPLSARYHPYSKPSAGPGASGGAPGGLPGSLGASPFSAFNPAGLGPYYSPYALYGQRIGAAAVHP